MQEHAIRRHREGADAGCVGNSPHEVDDARPGRRFPACQPELVKPCLGKQANQEQDLPILHELPARLVGGVLRHAIDAAQVAAVGQADTQVVDIPAESIESHGGLSGRS